MNRVGPKAHCPEVRRKFWPREGGWTFGSGIARISGMQLPQGEENDVPFVGNELRDQPGTMGKGLDTADAPGKADSEMGEEEVFGR